MNLRRCTLFFSILIMSLSPCFAMDTDPQKLRQPQYPVAQTSTLLALPGEILEHILTFVVAQDPDAIGNLARIQEVCKGLAGFLSKDEMKWILKLDEHNLTFQLRNALFFDNLDLTKIQLLINLGALSSNECKDGMILHAVYRAAYADTKDYYQHLLQVISILEKAGGTWKGSKYATHEDTLRYAVRLQKIPLIRLLLEHDIKPTQQAVEHTIIFNSPEVAALLMKYGAPNTANLMRTSICCNNPAILQILINYGADVNQVDDRNRTPLSYVSNPDGFAKINYKKIAKILLQAGAIPQGTTLPDAVLFNNIPLAQLLINHGADVNAIEGHDYPMPPLAFAQTPEMAKILLKAGAQLFIDCGQGQASTPFSRLVTSAISTKNPMILVEILKTRYPYPTALAIAVALINGAPYVSAMCTIL